MVIFITNHKARLVSAPHKQKKTVVGKDLNEEQAYEMNEMDSIHSDLKNHYKLLKIPFTTYKKINQFLYPPISGHTNQQTINYASPHRQTTDLETYHFDTTTYYQEHPYCRLSCSNIQTIFNLSNQPAVVPVKNNTIFQELTKYPVQNSFSKETNEMISSSAKPSPLSARIQVPVVLGEYNMEICIDETTQINKGIVGIKEVSKEVVLTHCHFLPTSYSPSFDQTKKIASAGTLFVEGFIQEGIKYIPAINHERTPPREWIKKVFTHIDQKIMIDLKIQLLQIQQVETTDITVIN